VLGVFGLLLDVYFSRITKAYPVYGICPYLLFAGPTLVI